MIFITLNSYALSRLIRSIGVSNAFVAQGIHHTHHRMGLIAGQITTDGLLENIFSKFRIGK